MNVVYFIKIVTNIILLVFVSVMEWGRLLVSILRVMAELWPS